ncbi:MAG: hypothetical protein IPG09_18385 [Ignavibacteria bacterium]|nr:hypothetical protein [Ignavibacteria bacterium]
MAYRDNNIYGGTLAVKKFDGIGWTGIGYYHNNYPRISDGTVENISLAIDNDGTPTVAYRDNNIYGGTLAVKNLIITIWICVGDFRQCFLYLIHYPYNSGILFILMK